MKRVTTTITQLVESFDIVAFFVGVTVRDFVIR